MLTLHTDHYFHIGQLHFSAGKPCQDYATSGVHDGAAYATVSDGCSKGGQTDVGARILALGTASAIRKHWTQSHTVSADNGFAPVEEDLEEETRATMENARKLFNLEDNDMLATSLYAYLSPSGGFIRILGDGVLAIQYRNGSIAMRRFDWADNTPFYPVYRGESRKRFIAAHGGDLDAQRLVEEWWLWEKEKFSDSSPLFIGYSLVEGIFGITFPIPCQGKSLEDISCIALFSDGVTQIENVDWKEAVVAFLQFKSTAGEFLKRRMMRGIKEFQAKGRGPLDDIACAIVRIEKEEEKEDRQ